MKQLQLAHASKSNVAERSARQLTSSVTMAGSANDSVDVTVSVTPMTGKYVKTNCQES